MTLNADVLTIALFSLIIFIQPELSAVSGKDLKPKCFGLKFAGEITCTSPTGNGGVRTNCEGPQEVGTIVEYKCKQHFILYEIRKFAGAADRNQLIKEGVLECNKNGTWTGYQKFENIRCREQCGKRVITNPKPLIVNGVPTNTTSWPWHATLFRAKGKEMEYICGGTIIRSSAILTAAHCVNQYVSRFQRTRNSLVVVLGAVSSNFSMNREHAQVQTFQVRNVFVSEHYDERKEFRADIAIIELEGEIVYGDYVAPSCLPSDLTMDSHTIREGMIGDVVGFGVDEDMKISQILKHGRLEIHSHSECFIHLEQRLTSSQFCAGSRRANVYETVCNGDSGGGLFIPQLTDEKYYVHGIVSTGKFSCHGLGVFTRVQSFIPWIRNILEQITEDKEDGPELDPSNGFDFILNGTEGNRLKFSPIPLQWRNKVRSVQLSYVDIDPGLLLDSLQYSKTVCSLNLSQVEFTKWIPNGRVRLPHLESFHLDVLRNNLSPSASANISAFLRTPRFKNFVSSLKLFEKSSTDSSDITQIASSLTKVYIGVMFFKLIEVNHVTGHIALSRLDWTDQILANIFQSPGALPFNLRNLALSSCSFNHSAIPGIVQVQLKSLVLDRVVNTNNILKSLTNFKSLRELVLVAEPGKTLKQELDIEDFPKTLKHLALSGIKLELKSTSLKIRFSELLTRRVTTKAPSSITFPSPPVQYSHRAKQSGNVSSAFLNVETFYCDSCLSPNISIQHVHHIFPNLKVLILKLDALPPGGARRLEELVIDFAHLETIVLLPVKDGARGIKLVRTNGMKWTSVPPILNLWSAEQTHLDYLYNRRQNFLTSEADHVCSSRLSSVERSAFKSGVYKFEGDPDQSPFVQIPVQIQTRLETIEISNSEISPQTLLESLRNCSLLKFLRLWNVTALNMLNTESPVLPALDEYRAEQSLIPVWEVFSYSQFTTVMDSYFPFQFFFSEPHLQSPLTALLQSRVRKIRVGFGGCVQASWDSDQGILISTSTYASDWLRNGPSLGVSVKKLALQNIQLDPAVVPPSVSHLNLNFVILNDFGGLLDRLTALKSLKLVNVRMNSDAEEDSGSWEWPELDVTQLATLHSKSLEDMTLERVHLKISSPGVKFEKLQTLYLESCTFEEDFVRDFTKVFPKLQKIIFLTNPEADDIGERRVLQEALKCDTLKWVLSDGWSDTESERTQIGNDTDSQVERYLIAKRAGPKSPWKFMNTDKVNMKSRLLRTKGTVEFGVSNRCHAFNTEYQTDV